jgi:hypothetical protein
MVRMTSTLNLVGAWRLTSSYFVDEQTNGADFHADVFGSAVFDRGRMTVLMTSGARTRAESDSEGLHCLRR